MQFRVILTSFTLAAFLCLPNPLFARSSGSTSSGDEAVLEMSQAFKKGDRKRLTSLLPKVQGHVLEPWA
ncbi:MAG: lytic transglycosylase domain-containing protein, partial [Hylemonella sp.]